jgi:hypothetical protein
MQRYVHQHIDVSADAGQLPPMGAKDWLLEKTAVAMLNQSVVKPYGEVTRLKLDTAARSIEAELNLNGEVHPVTIHVREYELIETAGAVYFIIRRITTSRDWLTRLAEDFAVDRRFQVPPSVQRYLPMLM